MLNYEIHLSYNNREEAFKLPVNPSTIEISDGLKTNSYEVLSLGEINVIKNTKLTEYSFSSYFPGDMKEKLFIREGSVHLENTDELKIKDDPEKELHNYAGFDGNAYVYLLLKWMYAKRPIRFIFIGEAFSINIPVTIEDFQWKETAGRGGDIEYSLKLKKYIFYKAQKITFNEEESVARKEPPEREDQRDIPSTYTLVKGDTLWSVAKRFLGNGARWPEIQKLNGIKDSEIRRLPIGLVLKLPEVK